MREHSDRNVFEPNSHAMNPASSPAGDAPGGPSDEALLVALSEGRGHALDVLVMRYASRVQSYLRHVTGDGALAEDLAQDVFLTVYRHGADPEPIRHFRVWLFRVARNAAFDHLRNRKTNARAMERLKHRFRALLRREQEVPSTPERSLLESELSDALERALTELPDEQRDVFLLREREGLSYEDIATIAGCKVKTVSTRLHRARVQLRMLLADHLEDPS